jgi:hypothetical protein
MTIGIPGRINYICCQREVQRSKRKINKMTPWTCLYSVESDVAVANRLYLSALPAVDLAAIANGDMNPSEIALATGRGGARDNNSMYKSPLDWVSNTSQPAASQRYACGLAGEKTPLIDDENDSVCIQ